jgi:hypothetical protein
VPASGQPNSPRPPTLPRSPGSSTCSIPKNDLKWAALRPDQKTFDFTHADQIVGFARVHGMKVRGQFLVWGWSNRAWLAAQHFTSERLSARLHEHITRVMSHYGGQIYAWTRSTKPSTSADICALPSGTTSPGIEMAGKSTAYIEQVFRWRARPIGKRSSSTMMAVMRRLTPSRAPCTPW